jgi:cyclopropane fatty-acyl-phospholipid synthase-like methyltransferase
VLADEAGIASIPDGSVDAVVSLAVVQHLSKQAYEKLLAVCYAKLADGGKIVLHVQLDEGSWKREDDWKGDTSVKGRLKYSYGLHNFGRPKSEHLEMVQAAGFSEIQIVSLAEAFPGGFEDIGEQHLLTATKP